MIDELVSKIDTKKIIETLSNLSIQIPSIAWSVLYTVEQPRVSIVQLSYDGSEYEITKFYITINPNLEIALKSDYTFDALNVALDEEENTIHAYNANNEEVASYYINRDALTGYNNSTYMRKSTGDIYIPPFRAMDREYESVRKQWDSTEKLLCYSTKLDGRMCFYITINLDLDYQLKEDLFVSGGE